MEGSLEVSYHNIEVGMRFREVQHQPPRIVRVTETSLYSVLCEIEQGRGKGKTIQLWRKHLSDASRWRLLEPEPDTI